MSHGHTPRTPGAIAWMARNAVAANLLMLVLVLGGLLLAPRIKQEVFPEFTLDIISISVAYPGASPSEVEQGVVLPVEEAVRGIDGVKTVTSSASESVGSVTVELLTGTDRDVALADIKSAVDRITLFPADAERPVIAAATNRQENVRLVLHGDIDEAQLRAVAVETREALLARGYVTLVELSGVRPPEISIEVAQAQLRAYGLTLDGIAQAVRQASVELPAGGLRTPGGEILLRTTERRDAGVAFEEIVLRSSLTGAVVTVGDVATVQDGFRETDQSARFNGQRAATLQIFRVGDQSPIAVTAHVKEFLETYTSQLPSGVSATLVNDRSEIYRDRISLLLRNAGSGLILVLLVLGVFLELKLAFWVTLGIPISFLGAMLFMPSADASLNMISLFAFILTLGIVVDDAIVVGEAVYHQRSLGKTPMQAAIDGAREVAAPVTFSVLTTIIAFMPLLFVPGVFGKFMYVIPVVVILILLMSLVESLFILPAHLAHSKPGYSGGLLGAVASLQERFTRGFDWFVVHVFAPSLRPLFRLRYAMLAVGVAVFVLTIGVVRGGGLQFTFMPKIEGDVVTATLELPFGTPVEQTSAMISRLEAEAVRLLEANGGVATVGRGIYADIGVTGGAGGGPGGGGRGATGSHMGSVTVFMVPVDQRPIGAAAFASQWREAFGEVAGIESLTFRFDTGPSGGSAIDVQLSHGNIRVLEAAASEVARQIQGYAGVFEIDDGFAEGKEQFDMTLRPAGRALGITETELARQVRAAFFGAEAVRQQRGRDELRVFVRRPLEERQSEYYLENMLLRAPDGTEIALRDAAHLDRGRSYTTIRREDGRRVVSVTADVDTTVTTANDVNQSIRETVLPDVLARFPGLSAGFAGQAREQGNVLSGLASGLGIAVLAMYALMAIVLRSYVQPLLILFAIPFGFVGAAWGHMFLGYSLSFISIFGLVALSGVVVNDSIVLMDAVNRYRETATPFEAAIQGSARRLRPILLTSLTTFFGLAPMLLETSVQARFLIPMAISLAFGVLFATVVTLVLVPCGYLVFDDISRAVAWLRRKAGLVEEDPDDEDEDDHPAPFEDALVAPAE